MMKKKTTNIDSSNIRHGRTDESLFIVITATTHYYHSIITIGGSSSDSNLNLCC